MSTDERSVSLGEVEPERAVSHLASEGKGATRLADIEGSVPQFKSVDVFTTFRAEWDLIGDDVVVHFFVAEKGSVTRAYWVGDFPEALNTVAQEHFDATLPRLVAKYTDEDPSTGERINSWWFKAQRYGHLLDLDGYMMRFFEKLDERLDPILERARPAPR